MCHQTVGLVARHVEQAGISTLTMSVGRDISEHVMPPRTAFVNYPMGNEIGRPEAEEEQRGIVRGAFAALSDMTVPGKIVDLPFELDFADEDGHDWREWVYTKGFRERLMKTRAGRD